MFENKINDIFFDKSNILIKIRFITEYKNLKIKRIIKKYNLYYIKSQKDYSVFSINSNNLSNLFLDFNNKVEELNKIVDINLYFTELKKQQHNFKGYELMLLNTSSILENYKKIKEYFYKYKVSLLPYENSDKSCNIIINAENIDLSVDLNKFNFILGLNYFSNFVIN